MKYRDIITIFMVIIFFLSLGFAVGVNQFYWFLPVIILIFLSITLYKLWIEK